MVLHTNKSVSLLFVSYSAVNYFLHTLLHSQWNINVLMKILELSSYFFRVKLQMGSKYEEKSVLEIYSCGLVWVCGSSTLYWSLRVLTKHLACLIMYEIGKINSSVFQEMTRNSSCRWKAWSILPESYQLFQCHLVRTMVISPFSPTSTHQLDHSNDIEMVYKWSMLYKKASILKLDFSFHI